MWVDVTQAFGGKWKTFFQHLHATRGLDPVNRSHRWLLQFLFLQHLNRDAKRWVKAWNSHVLTLHNRPNASPEELFLFGSVENGAVGMEEDVGRPEEYGIDWADMDLPSIVNHYLSRNHLASSDDSRPNVFGMAVPASFKLLEVEDEACPLTQHQLSGLVLHVRAHCELNSESMEERQKLWTVALDYVLTM